MKVVFLRDITDGGCIDAVIISNTSTAEEIQEAIDNMKSEKEQWEWEDLKKAMPGDCMIFDKWSEKSVNY